MATHASAENKSWWLSEADVGAEAEAEDGVVPELPASLYVSCTSLSIGVPSALIFVELVHHPCGISCILQPFVLGTLQPFRMHIQIASWLRPLR